MSDIFDMTVAYRGSEHSPTKTLNQKIDIVITENQRGVGSDDSRHDRTLVGIELKGINTKDQDIILDAERMAQAMILTDSISDNSILFCFCCCLKRLDKDKEMLTDESKNTKIQNEKNRWEKICEGLSIKFSTLIFSLDIFEIVSTPLESLTRIGEDHFEIANETGAIIGVILSINRKE